MNYLTTEATKCSKLPLCCKQNGVEFCAWKKRVDVLLARSVTVLGDKLVQTTGGHQNNRTKLVQPVQNKSFIKGLLKTLELTIQVTGNTTAGAT